MRNHFRIWVLFSLATILAPAARGATPRIDLPLAGDLRPAVSSRAEVSVSGPYRFLRINGKTGYHALSPKTTLRIVTSLQRGPEGSISLWICPLEELGVAAGMPWFMEPDPYAQEYALIGDTFPPNDHSKNTFSWYWRSAWHPQMVAQFFRGNPKAQAGVRLVPYVMTEHLPLHEKHWYQLTLTWNKPVHRLRTYVNGILCGATDYPFRTEDGGGDALYVGNPAMVFAGLRIYDSELSAEQVARSYAGGDEPRTELLDLFTVRPRPPADWHPDEGWKLADAFPFTRPADLAGWTRQGCFDPHPIRELRTTDEGLLIETPPEIASEARMYLWSPRNYEGDVALEMEFRPERDSGLALMVFQASGMQREDFLTDQPRRTTGSMATIIQDRVRNYHWEFFRRTGDVRADLGTQILVKNPWKRPLGMATLERIKIGQWHRLLFVQEGGHLRCAIDGEWAMDVHDDPFANSGPVFNYGRIGIRLMYNTRMRFRNLRIWNRNEGVSVVGAAGPTTGADGDLAGAGRARVESPLQRTNEATNQRALLRRKGQDHWRPEYSQGREKQGMRE